MGRQSNTYVLKPYLSDEASKCCGNKVAAFRRARDVKSPNLMGFYGSFTQEQTFNIILEYANGGILEDYFRSTPPPSTARDRISFWRRSLMSTFSLKAIHEMDSENPVEGRIFHGYATNPA